MPLSLQEVKASNFEFSPSYLPVAIFFGGTSGIGKSMAQLFAKITNGHAHIILVGRNRAAAEAIIASFPKPTDSDYSGWKHEFIPCDIFLMKNVHSMIGALLERVPRVNFVVICSGGANLGRRDTVEGIDETQAGRYYSRFAIIHDILPALKQAKEEGQYASVMSVLGAGFSPKVDTEDMGLKKNFSSIKSIWQTSAYNDLMVAEYAKRYPDIAFTHIHPGAVDTGSIYRIDNWLVKLFIPLFYILAKLAFTSADECAEFMLYGLLQGKAGMYRKTRKAEDLGMIKFPGTEEDQLKLWDHSMEATNCSV